MKVTKKTVDYVWNNFKEFIFDKRCWKDFFEDANLKLIKDKNFMKLFGGDLKTFWKIFIEFRELKALLPDDDLKIYCWDGCPSCKK